jgi:hypothetical protein
VTSNAPSVLAQLERAPPPKIFLGGPPIGRTVKGQCETRRVVRSPVGSHPWLFLLDGGIEVVSHGGAVCAFPSRARARSREPSRALAPIPRAREAKLVSEVAPVRSSASDENLEIDIFLLPHGASRCVDEARAKNGAHTEL